MQECPSHTSTFLKLVKSLIKLEYFLPVNLRGGTEEKKTKENGSDNKPGKFSDY